MSFWVYILASRRNGTLYIGMTDEELRDRAGREPLALWRTNRFGAGRPVPFSASVVTRAVPALSIVFTSLVAGRRVRRISVGGLP